MNKEIRVLTIEDSAENLIKNSLLNVAISPLTPIDKGPKDFLIKENIKEFGIAVNAAPENNILNREKDLEKRILKLHRTYAVIHRIK
jgi:hypothetical protein